MDKKILKIGNIELENPFLLAPLAGITDAPMRRLCKEQGAAMVYSEMVSAKGLYYGDKNTERLLYISDDEKPVAFQFFGSEPEMLEFAARKTASMGNAIFDINMGCPVPKIVKNGEGSALLKNPDLVYDIVCAAVKGAREGARELNAECIGCKGSNCITQIGDTTRNDGAGNRGGISYESDGRYGMQGTEHGMRGGCGGAGSEKQGARGGIQGTSNRITQIGDTDRNDGAGRRMFEPKPVTVKIRMGFDENSINAVEIAKAAEAAGAAAVAVHGRTREQYYSGCADWTGIRKVKEALRIPVIGNGDVFTGEDGRAIIEQTGCDFVMIARGALGNPWIFAELVARWHGEPLPSPPSVSQKVEMLLRHFEEVLAFKGEYVAVREMRKHVGWYLKGCPHSAAMRRRVSSIETAQELRRALAELAAR